jgi:prevent-host-death family protein
MTKPAVVGARELKTRLGTYLRRAREGQRIVVTERGTPVAELRGLSAEAESLEGRLERLESAGLVSRPSQRAFAPFRRVKSRGASASRAVVDGREDRF